MWFALSLVALLCWSGSDLFSKIGSKPSDKLSHWKMVMAVGLVMGLHAAYEVFVGGVEISWQTSSQFAPPALPCWQFPSALCPFALRVCA